MGSAPREAASRPLLSTHINCPERSASLLEEQPGECLPFDGVTKAVSRGEDEAIEFRVHSTAPSIVPFHAAGDPFDMSTHDVVKHADPWDKNSCRRATTTAFSWWNTRARIESAAKSRRDGAFYISKAFFSVHLCRGPRRVCADKHFISLISCTFHSADNDPLQAGGALYVPGRSPRVHSSARLPLRALSKDRVNC